MKAEKIWMDGKMVDWDDPRADPQIRLWFGETIEKVEKRAELLKLGRFKLVKEN